MSVWILLVVFAQFLNAIVAIVDKYIIAGNIIPRPIAYAFYLSILSAFSGAVFFFSWVPIPLEGVTVPSITNVLLPSVTVLWISLVAGAALFGALVSLFSALKRADASDVFPIVGAFSAVGALVLSYFLLDAALTPNFFWGFALLVAGSLFLSLYRFRGYVLATASASGLLFALHFVCLKFLFAETSFDNAFFWTRVGIVAVALLVLLIPFCRRQLSFSSKKAQRRAGAFVIGNKILAGLASLMLLKAIELGDVSIVQALGSLQFAFILGFTAILGERITKACGEACTARDLAQKTIAVTIIMAGFFLLFL